RSRTGRRNRSGPSSREPTRPTRTVARTRRSPPPTGASTAARRSSPQCGPRPSFSPLSGVPVRSVYALCTRAVNPSVVEIILNQYERTVVRDTQGRSQVTISRRVHATVGRAAELATLAPVPDSPDPRLRFFQLSARRGLARRDCNMLVVPPVRVHVVAQLQLDPRVQGRQVLDERSHG